MAIIALASSAGAPGVTTAATALAVHWPRPVLLIEANTSAVSTMMAGFFRSNLRTTEGGIEKLAFAVSRNALDVEDILDPAYKISIPVHDLPPIADMPIPATPSGHKLWVIPGFVNLAIVDGVRGLWGKLPSLLSGLSQGGIDVILDLGHLDVDDPRLALLDVADKVFLIASSTMIDLNRTFRRLELPDLAQRARALAGEKYWSILTTPVAEPIPDREFSAHILPVAAVLPHDTAGAAVFSHGRPDPKPERNKYRQAIRRTALNLQVLGDKTNRSAS